MENKGRKLKTLLTGGAIIAFFFMLVACHSEPNPLLKAKPKTALHWIYAAQYVASKKTHVYDFTDSAYLVCVTNPSHFNNPLTGAKNRCGEFLQAMVDYAKKSPGFKDLTVSDLKDKAVIARFQKQLMFGEGSN